MNRIDELTALLEHLNCERVELRTELSRPELGDKLLCTCPMHSDENPSFMLRVEAPFIWNCFSCGGGIGLNNLVMRSQLYEGCNRLHASRIVAQFVDLSKSELRHQRDEDEKPVQPLAEIETAAYSGTLETAYQYCATRGISREVCELVGVGYDRKRQRVTIPIRARDGTLMAFIGRTVLPDGQPRYLVYDRRPRDRLLLGIDQFQESGNKVILVEGSFDYLRLRSYGVRNVLAILGSKVSRQQLQTLLSINKPIYGFLDNDQAGAEGIMRLYQDLQGTLPLYVPCYQAGDKDPGSTSKERFVELIKTAKPPHSVKLKQFK